jgi:hypothetical protein
MGTPPVAQKKTINHENCGQPSNFSVHSPSPTSALSSFSGFRLGVAQNGAPCIGTFQPTTQVENSPLETSTFSFMDAGLSEEELETIS